VGREGQLALKNARVLLVGAGGLGSPLALYLAAAGVGTLGVVEYDDIEASNLHRQVLYGAEQIGKPKLDAAVARLQSLNPHIQVVPHPFRLTSENAMDVIARYDLVADGTDNFSARYLVNDACVLNGKLNVHASIYRFDGMVSIFGAATGPCYRCIYPEPPPPGLVPSCAEAGVLGVLPGIVGALQANEVIKLLLGIGDPLIGRLLQFDALTMQFREFAIQKDAACPICSSAPSIKALVDYAAFCGLHAEEAPHGDSITVAQLNEKLGAGAALSLIDVRNRAEYDAIRIDGARLLPLDELLASPPPLDGDNLIVCYCQSGVRSAKAARALQQFGFPHVASLEGGILAWLKSGTQAGAQRPNSSE